MVGDASNDATAFSTSDLGIAMRSRFEKPLVEQEAGVILQKSSLFPIVTALDIAKNTKRNIFQNLFVSLTYNTTITLVAGGLFIAATGGMGKEACKNR